MAIDFGKMKDDLYQGKADEIKEATSTALEEGLTPQEILDKGLIAGMDVVGKDFREGILFIPEVLMCARAMHAGMDLLKPLLEASGAASPGKVAIGTVKGDLHDIGKNLVMMMLQGAGFEIIDLGTDVSPEKFVEAVQNEGADIVGMSALLTTTMPSMKATIEALDSAGLRGNVKVMIGGAAVTSKYAEGIGADKYAPDAAAAVDTARLLIG